MKLWLRSLQLAKWAVPAVRVDSLSREQFFSLPPSFLPPLYPSSPHPPLQHLRPAPPRLRSLGQWVPGTVHWRHQASVAMASCIVHLGTGYIQKPQRNILILRPAQLPHHIPETEDAPKHQFRIVFCAQHAGLGCVVCDGDGGGGRWDPFFLVDA